MTVKLIKTIGLLGIVGEGSVNLKASKALLRYALDDGTETFQNEVDEPVESFERALAMLEQHSIAIYRRYNDAYALWEGSDIDIEGRVREAAAHLDPNLRLPTALSTLMQPQSLIARRHLFVTGTLRHFAVQYTDLEGFDTDLMRSDDTDGLVLYTLPASELEVGHLVKKATEVSVRDREDVLIAIPQSIGFLRDVVVELWCLGWVEENTPQLAGDATARRELRSRRTEVEREVSVQLTSLFGGNISSPQESINPVPNDKSNTGEALWYHKGQRTQITSRRALNAYLSEICDSVYHATPILRNELINRRQISSQAAAARKKLIAGMLDFQQLEKLDIKSYPPEMSIYLSLLFDTGIHRHVWGFGDFIHRTPMIKTASLPLGWRSRDFLTNVRRGANLLANSMNGGATALWMRRGPMPILLCAVLLHYETEIALYEDGSFVADISMPGF